VIGAVPVVKPGETVQISVRTMPHLTPDDSRRLDALARDNLAAAEPRWVTHRFTFFFNGAGAAGASTELKRLGWPRVTVEEEVPDGDCWHVCAWRTQALTEDCVARTRAELEALAARHGGEYESWELTRDGLGRMPDPAETRFMVRSPRRDAS
jgi:regulator of ribonuclease activity B